MRTKKSELTSTYAQSIGAATAKELIAEAIGAAVLEDKDSYTEEETARICSELAKQGGLVRIVAQSFLVQLERKKSEEQALLLDNIDTQIWYLTGVGTYGAVNQARAEFLGMAKGDLEDRNLRDVVSRENAEACIARNREVVDKRRQTRTEEWTRNGVGETRLLSVTRTPKLDDKGNVEYVICAALDITERRKAEEGLRESEERFRALIENSSDIIQVVDSEGVIRYVSPSVQRILGYEPEELVGRLSTDVVHPDDLPEIASGFREAFQAPGVPVVTECRCRHKDGAWRVIEGTGTNRLGSPAVRGFIANMRDVTERRKAEQRIRHLNSVLRAIRNVNQLIVAEKDRDSLLQKACDALVEARSYDAAWLALLKDGEGFATVAGAGPGEEASRIREHLARGDLPLCVKTALAQEETPLVFDKPSECRECPFRSAYAGQTTVIIRVEHGGMLFGLLAISLGPDTDADQEERDLLTEVARDIAIALHNMELEESHERADQALRESEARFRTLLESVPNVAVQGYGPDGTVQYWNRACETVYGYEAAEAIGKNIVDLIIPPEMTNEVREAISRGARTGEMPPPSELSLLRKDGTRVSVFSSHAVVNRPSGEPELFCIDVNLTELKRATEALRESEEKYRLLAETARDLIITHDMQGRITYVNRAALESSGYSEEEALQMNIADVVPADQLAQMKERQASRVTSDPGVHIYETELITKAGRRVPIEVASSQLMEQGKPSGVLIIARDITKRVRAEKFQTVAYRIANAAIQTTSLEDLFRFIHAELGIVMYTKNFYISLYDAEKESLSFPYYVDENYPEPAFSTTRFRKAGKGLTEYLLKIGKALLVTRDSIEELAEEGETEIIGPLPLSWLGTPLKIEGRTIGATALQSYTSSTTYTRDDLELLEFVSGQIAIVIERKRAEETLRKSNEAMSLLYEAGRRLSRTLDLDTLYSDTHDLISRIMDCDNLLVSSYNPEDGLIRCDRVWHEGKPFPAGHLPPIPLEPEGHGSQSAVIRTGQPLLIRDYPERLKQTKTAYFVNEKGRMTEQKDLVRNGAMPRSALLVPLKVEGQVVRVIKVSSYAYDAYTEDDLELLDSLAAQIALALRNATLYQQAQNEISERVVAEKALRASEERFRQMAEVIPAIFWMFSGDNQRALYASPAFETVYGRPCESLYEKPELWLDAIHPEDHERVIAAEEEYYGEEHEKEYRIVRPDGSIRWIHDLVLPVRDERGEIARIVGFSEDITERKLAEENLQSERAQLLSVFDSINEIIYVADPKTYEILYANKTLTDAFGKSLVGGICYREFQGLESPCDFCTNDAILRDKGKPYHWEHHNPILNRDYMIVDRMIDWPDGREVRFELAVDITERKRAEETLRRRDSILEAIGLAAEQFLGTADWERCIDEVLAHLGQATEASRVYVFESHAGDDGVVLASQCYEWVAPGVEPQIDDPKLQGLPLRVPGSTRWEHYLSQGQPIYGHVREFPASEQEILAAQDIKSIVAVPVFAGKEWWGFLGFDFCLAEREWSVVEIDALKTAASTLGAAVQRRQAEEERARLEAELVHSQKMEAIGQLAGGVAHDFNNVLTAIQGYTEFALMALQEDDPAYRDIREVQRASVRAANLTRQLLLFSRRQPMMIAPLSLDRLLIDLSKMLRRLIGEDVTLITDLGPDLWTVEGDSGSIESVVMNLVVNARDAMPEGGEITVKSENLHVDEEYCRTCGDARMGEFVCLSVRDTGMGIDPAIIGRIFEPFFTTKEPGTGTGMGLAVVYGIVRQHEGWVTVESSPGRGATFRVYLPAGSAQPAEEPPAPLPIETFRGKGERILLVEDEAAIREFSARGLSEHGYVAYPAASAQQARGIFEQQDGEFDLILSDLVLTDGSGLKLAQGLLERKPGIRLLFASGYSAEKADWRAIQEHDYPFIQKPYSLSDLLAAVKRVLE